MKPFADRFQAGRILASKLASYRERPSAVVLALPRGGVPVAYEIAKELYIDMDVFLVRKLPLPTNPELSIGIITSGGARILEEEIVQALSISPDDIDASAQGEQKQLIKWERFYRGDRPDFSVSGRSVILVDDGVAPGTIMKAAAVALRRQQAARIVVAVPAGSSEAWSEFETEADEVICATLTDSFHSAESWYENSAQITDEDVGLLLKRVSSIKASPTAGETI